MNDGTDARARLSIYSVDLSMVSPANPLLSLPDEPAFACLGPEFADPVQPARFPRHLLRFRNDDLVMGLGLDPAQVSDQHFIEAFGQFQVDRPLLAMRYHGHQFGDYNPFLGDGRGFLYGQFRGKDNTLYDLGTKGSGTTPYSRGADGRLTLKGGIREVLAGEALHRLGVRTCRVLSLIETGESLWRGDEPSPTRASVMVRMNRTHIRFGSFERLAYLQRPDLIRQLLDHVIGTYYTDLQGEPDPYPQFFRALVRRVAEMAAQWMSVGFCHGVLNTDNMSILGESFDYGPYAFIETYDPQFTAAYFDYWGYYQFGNQPGICRLNLERLQQTLVELIPLRDMDAALSQFSRDYQQIYTRRMMGKLGFPPESAIDPEEMVYLTLQLLTLGQPGYHEFFATLTHTFSPLWCHGADRILAEQLEDLSLEGAACLKQWRQAYHHRLIQLSPPQIEAIPQRLRQHNPPVAPIRSVIESVWEPIATEDDWLPFHRLLEQIRSDDWGWTEEES